MAVVALAVPFHALDRVQVDTPRFVFGMIVVLIAAVVLAVRLRRTPWLPLRYGLRGGVFLLLLLSAGAWVNAYFAYLPTLGEVLGRRATFQASRATVQRTLASVQEGALRRQGLGERRRFAVAGPGRGHPLSGTVTFLATLPSSAPPTPGPAVLPSHGLVELVNIPGKVSGFHARAAQVYLPPAWFDPVRPALPVVVLLQGTPGTPADWTRGGEADVTVDAWAAAHHGLAPVLVMPDPNGSPFGDTECVDAKEGRAETYLTQDIPAFMHATFGTATDRQSWAIGGLSEGGQCAITLTLRHPDVFSVFLSFGSEDHLSHDGGLTALFPGNARAAWAAAEAYAPRHLLAQAPALPVAGWFGAGQADGGITAAATRMSATATASGIDAHLGLIPDAHHTFRVWRDSFAQAVPWMLPRLRMPQYPRPVVANGPTTVWVVEGTPLPAERPEQPDRPLVPQVVVPPRVFVARDDLILYDENPLGRRALANESR